MKLLLIFFTLMCVTDTEAGVKQHALDLTACSDTDEEYMRGSDGEELFYADFKQKKLENVMPPFSDPVDFPGGYEFAEANMPICKHNLQVMTEDYKDQPVPQDAPQNSIYTRDDVQLGSQNTLICHFTRFFPPHVTVHWTKNGEDVTDKSTLSQFYPNEDSTYNQFSHLSFTPQEGDIYTCTVEHKALDSPDTRTWGLLGVATGTFFLVKGNQCN